MRLSTLLSDSPLPEQKQNRKLLVTGEATVHEELVNYLGVESLSPIGLSQTKVRSGKCRVLIRQLRAEGDGIIVPPSRVVNRPEGNGVDGR